MPSTLRELGSPANAYLIGLRRENRGMRLRVRDEQLPLRENDPRRAGGSQPSLVVGPLRVEDPGTGSLSRVLARITLQTFASADGLLRELERIDPRVGVPWRILAVDSLQPVGEADDQWQFEMRQESKATELVRRAPRPAPRFTTVADPPSLADHTLRPGIRGSFDSKSVLCTQPTANTDGPPVPDLQIPRLLHAATAPTWLGELLASEVLGERMQVLARSAPSVADVEQLLCAITKAGARMTVSALAHEMGRPVTRIRGMLAAMQRLVNYDGIQVLRVEQASDTVCLEAEVLKHQFGLAD